MTTKFNTWISCRSCRSTNPEANPNVIERATARYHAAIAAAQTLLNEEGEKG
jgi:hypothetical protein